MGDGGKFISGIKVIKMNFIQPEADIMHKPTIIILSILYSNDNKNSQ